MPIAALIFIKPIRQNGSPLLALCSRSARNWTSLNSFITFARNAWSHEHARMIARDRERALDQSQNSRWKPREEPWISGVLRISPCRKRPTKSKVDTLRRVLGEKRDGGILDILVAAERRRTGKQIVWLKINSHLIYSHARIPAFRAPKRPE